MLEEYALLAFRPGDVVCQRVDLDLPTVWDRREEVKEGSDCPCSSASQREL